MVCARTSVQYLFSTCVTIPRTFCHGDISAYVDCFWPRWGEVFVVLKVPQCKLRRSVPFSICRYMLKWLEKKIILRPVQIAYKLANSVNVVRWRRYWVLLPRCTPSTKSPFIIQDFKECFSLLGPATVIKVCDVMLWPCWSSVKFRPWEIEVSPVYTTTTTVPWPELGG